MTFDTMAEVTQRALDRLGVKVERIDSAQGAIYISVPEHSHGTNARGEEMAGDRLARRVRTVIREGNLAYPRDTKVYARVRKGEYWTEADERQADVINNARANVRNAVMKTRILDYLSKRQGTGTQTNAASNGPEIIDVTNFAEEKP